MPVRICVLITSFNRKELTLHCLRALFSSEVSGVQLRVVLVDDASSDGTGDAVRSEFPAVEILVGDGTLYWNRGMLLAWNYALVENDQTDFYLWLNDDTALYPGALNNLLAVASKCGPRAIIVGRIADQSGRIIYGGMSYSENSVHFPFGVTIKYKAIELVTDDREECDTMNGNCVLFPSSVVAEIGTNNPIFWHAWGDVDYGFRARKAGYRIIQLLPAVASGTFNQIYQDGLKTLSLRNWKHVFFHPKGRRISESIEFYRNYLRPWWLPRMVLSYVRMIRR